MANPLYTEMQPQQDITSALNAIKKNPVQFLLGQNIQIPQNIANNPADIAQYLMNTGRISQSKYNQVMQMMQKFIKR